MPSSSAIARFLDAKPPGDDAPTTDQSQLRKRVHLATRVLLCGRTVSDADADLIEGVVANLRTAIPETERDLRAVDRATFPTRAARLTAQLRALHKGTPDDMLARHNAERLRIEYESATGAPTTPSRRRASRACLRRDLISHASA